MSVHPAKLTKHGVKMRLATLFSLISIPVIFLGAFIIPYLATGICHLLYSWGVLQWLNASNASKMVFYGVAGVVTLVYLSVAVAIIEAVKRRFL